MKRLLLVGAVVMTSLFGTAVFADQDNTSGYFGAVGRELPPHYPWEEVRRTRPTFGGSVKAESKAEYGPDAGLPGRQIPSRYPWREGISGTYPVSVRSVGDQSLEVKQPLDAIGR